MPPVGAVHRLQLHLMQRLAGFLERALRQQRIGNILANAEQANGVAFLVGDRLAAAKQVPDLAVGTDDALLDAEVAAGAERPLYRAPDAVPVVGVDAREESLEGAGEGVRPHAENVEQQIRPGHAVLGHVPHPAPEIGQALGLEEVDALLAQLDLDALMLRERGLESHVGRDQRGRALLDPLLQFSAGALEAFGDAPVRREAGAERQASAPRR